MNEDRLRDVLLAVQQGRLKVGDALNRLKHLPYEDIGIANLDHHRDLRTGFPEVVFCQGKSPEQVATIFDHLAAHNRLVMGTRADEEVYAAVRARLPQALYHEAARIIVVSSGDPASRPHWPEVAVVSAGTSDAAVVEEAAVTLEVMGHPVQRIQDVGVAGIHRLLARLPALQEARALIVVAGMEGALPSVVAGLVSRPVIAVPTSVGYGAHFMGLAPLLTMLNSCASGVAVVNIDNGFGAARFAHLITRNPEDLQEEG